MGLINSINSIYSYFYPEPEQSSDAVPPPSDGSNTERQSRLGEEQPNQEDLEQDEHTLDRSTEENNYDAHSEGSEMGSQTSLCVLDGLVDVDKMNLIVRYDGGKQMDVDVFPLEKVKTLLEEVCCRAGKNTEKMHLVFEGEPLDLTKTVIACRLRRGKLLILARKA